MSLEISDRVVVWGVVVGFATVMAGCAGKSPDGDSSFTGAAGNTGTLCGGDATGAATGTSVGPRLGSLFPPQVGATVLAAKAPPAISGGTLRILRDGVTAVASDPDRDRVYVVDLAARIVRSTVALRDGDEPGRVTEDGAGRVHVALRGGGALVTIDPVAGVVSDRRDVCSAPRGVAYDAATDLLHVACAGGELVSLPAGGGAATRTVVLDHDLRDVVVAGNELRVSRFRSAEVLTVAADGTVAERHRAPTFRSPDVRGGQGFSPAVAWKMEALPAGGGVVMVHQRGVDDEILVSTPRGGGYGSRNPCDGIVQTAVTVVTPSGSVATGPAMMGLVVPADLAISADGRRIAIISAGNATNAEVEGGPARLPRLFVTDMQSATDPLITCQPDGQHGPCLPLEGGPIPILAPSDGGIPTGRGDGGGGMTLPSTCDGFISGTVVDPSLPSVVGQPVAVAFDPAGNVVVQSREPALLQLPGDVQITLATESRTDTGHALFHANTGRGIACASCHAEGNDDGRVWKFACQGPRRTQSVQVGLQGTEPFHWDGSETDFPRLVHDVFSGRMSGPELAPDQIDATLRWLDMQPRTRAAAPRDTAAVARGQALFNDTSRGACVSCHAGEHLTNNMTVDVGTHGTFQVPSLVGVGMRGPYLHDGCAATLRDRFGPCGGATHGKTSTMTASEISDLVSYLETL